MPGQLTVDFCDQRKTGNKRVALPQRGSEVLFTAVRVLCRFKGRSNQFVYLTVIFCLLLPNQQVNSLLYCL